MPLKRSKKMTREQERNLDIEIGFLEGVVRRDPGYIDALQILGDNYTRRGRFEDGLKVDEQLVRLRPGDALVHYNLACSCSLTEQFEVIATRDFRETARAIREMVVRGAGAIGATTAYGLAQGARAFRSIDLQKFSRHIETVCQILKAARPTAVDPVNAMSQVRAAMSAGETVEEKQALALAAAEEFANDDVKQ